MFHGIMPVPTLCSPVPSEPAQELIFFFSLTVPNAFQRTESRSLPVITLRLEDSPCINIDDGISVRHPLGGIGAFKVFIPGRHLDRNANTARDNT